MANADWEPWMPEAERAHFRERLQGVETYLEFGSGGSTLWAADAGVANILSVESDLDFAEEVRKKVELHPRDVKFYGFPINIGPVKHHGRPRDNREFKRWPSYPLDVWEWIRENGLQPELILIDGRFRLACCAASLLWALRGTVVLFDDYGDRDSYHDVERLVPVRQRVGRMAEFVADDAVPEDKLARLLARSVVDPR